MRLVLVALLAIGCRPLQPGETRCANIYGTIQCKSGPPHPQTVVVQQPPAPASRVTWWCTTRIDDNFGTCAEQPGNCEVFRSRQAPDEWGPCVQMSLAICAPSGCFTTSGACATSERFAGRDGAACVQR